MNRRGQALVELSFWILLWTFLLTTLLSVSKWFLVSEKLVIGTREAAMLYSSGHLPRSEVERRVRLSLANDWPRLEGARLTLSFERDHHWGRLLDLDIIRIAYQPDGVLNRYFKKEIKEQCVIKHAPTYELPFTGPPFGW